MTRLYRRERRWAEVHLEPQSKTLFFILMQGVDERTAHVIYKVPLVELRRSWSLRPTRNGSATSARASFRSSSSLAPPG